MPAEKEDPSSVYPEEEDEDDDDESLDEDDDQRILQARRTEEEDEELEEEDLNSASASSSDDEEENPTKPTAHAQSVTVAVPPPVNGSTVVASEPPQPMGVVPTETPSPKRQRTDEKKPSAALDDSRRLFQRLWTDEDEIGLLQGFLEYTVQRSQSNSSSHHHDTTPFYDQIKTRLQLDFNKNQLVEKLRRLKKKYRNVLNRFGSGKEFTFKSPHDQATFEISRKIWSTASAETLEDDDGNTQNGTINNPDKKVSRSGRRSRKKSAPTVEDAPATNDPPPPPPAVTSSSVPNVIEDTVRSCLSPLFKELLQCALNGPCNSGIMGGLALNPLPLNFGGNAINLGNLEGVDERWRKQQILELEVYSKRLELVQEQIKSALADLKSIGG
ncbi:probable transcription factor At3g04930 [Aristolochia californica]|uniref:probable transcription factor At3g04930 n=1 Tax=Aristolochia californica TaxID=171875 RepID=UPI0035D52BF5